MRLTGSRSAESSPHADRSTRQVRRCGAYDEWLRRPRHRERARQVLPRTAVDPPTSGVDQVDPDRDASLGQIGMGDAAIENSGSIGPLPYRTPGYFCGLDTAISMDPAIRRRSHFDLDPLPQKARTLGHLRRRRRVEVRREIDQRLSVARLDVEVSLRPGQMLHQAPHHRRCDDPRRRGASWYEEWCR